MNFIMFGTKQLTGIAQHLHLTEIDLDTSTFAHTLLEIHSSMIPIFQTKLNCPH